MASHSLLVIKFGGSVLADRSAVPTVVREVSRYLGTHDRIVAVVSAFRNQTNILEHTALSLCHDPAPETLAFYMGLGEMHAAGELALALQGAGIPATLRMPWD
ncbi:MAG TPA: homoserine dehydrogenase, partial [Candidatus Krumholzibacteria bacterium]|nr:homoserine dehydrogenase [Candidatus Krumholzibacteria bacterium]